MFLYSGSIEVRWVVAMLINGIITVGRLIRRSPITLISFPSSSFGFLSVQSYYNSTNEWEYLTQLNKFVDDDMKDESFIEAVNNIVARGCHLPPCSPALSIKSDKYLFGFEVRA